jgi:aspartyl-tRNA(Asn)/glutamyl-tRNA(Gln) amidotransferase subunit A
MVNLFDRCAVTLPMHKPGTLPTGLMLVGETMGDERLLAVARAVEPVVSPVRERIDA